MYVLAREDGYRTNLELAGGLRNDVNAIVGRNKLLFSKGIIKAPWLLERTKIVLHSFDDGTRPT